MPVAGLIGAGVGLVGGAISRSNANKKLSKLLEDNPQYKENKIPGQQFALAKTLFNARMPGATAMERNIYTGGANALSNTVRNSTDSSKILGLGAAIQGQQGQQFQDLSIQEAQDYQRRYQNQFYAGNALVDEQQMVFQDDVRRFQDRAQIQGAQAQNNGATWQELSNFGMGVANFGLSGGFDGIGGNNSPGANAWKMPRMTYNPQKIPYR